MTPRVPPPRVQLKRGARQARRRWVPPVLLLWLVTVLPPPATAADEEIAGRYQIVLPPSPEGNVPRNGSVAIAARRSTYVVNWQPGNVGNRRRQRGLALRDGADLLGVSVHTGGMAYGLAIYHREAGGWRGKWITSVDGGGNVGEIRFDGAEPLAGRHRVSGRRAGAGGFEGAVTITQSGENYLLTFTVGGVTVYRGLGARRGERLVVAWSFGSAPALAVYERTAGSDVLHGQRLSLRAGQQVQAEAEDLTRAAPGEFDPAPGGDALALPSALVEADDAPAAPGMSDLLGPPPPEGGDARGAGEPAPADVKTWSYDDLLSRHGADGLAARWLREQLTPDERRSLEAAVRRRRPGEGTPATAPADAHGGPTVAELIEEEQNLGTAR